ncbi:MAG: aminoacyl-tRNA hydrolase [bacterium]
MYIIVGLGNPGEEYESTRHNVGRFIATSFAKQYELPDFSYDKKFLGLVSKGEIEAGKGKSKIVEKVTVILPETFMNKSGKSLADLITSEKKAEKLIVIQDDLDLPFGAIKMVFNRGMGGHRGLESIRKAIKTDAFIRVKIGVSPTTPTGKIKKPKGEEKVVKFILGKFKDDEMNELKKIAKRVSEGLYVTVTEDRFKAMNSLNTAN